MDLASLPQDCFVSRVPAAWRHRVPRVVQTPEGAQWVAGEHGEYKCGLWASAGPKYHMRYHKDPNELGPRERAKLEAGFKPEDRRTAVPALRIQDQELDGVEAEVIYGAALGLGRRIPDPEVVAVCLSAYNEWIAEFNQTNPGRFYGLGAVMGNNAETATREIEHAAKLGLPGVELPMVGLAKPLWHPSWEPVWAAVAKHRLPVHLHIGGGGTTTVHAGDGREPIPGLEHSASSLAAFVCVVTMQADELLASLIFCGALERHPDLKVVFGECDVGWIPYLLERMDYLFEDNYFKWKELITTKPSELFRRHLYSSFERDSIGPRLAAEFCPDNFMWGNDYPHTNDATWPNSREAIERYLGGIDEAMRQKLLHDNAAALYHIA
jgi:predicted TIM-barrel fold metal-dependent hydrolase